MPKNIAIRGSFIARRSMTASGRLRAAKAIMKASAVPKGIPLLNKTIAIGTIAAQLPYIGVPKITAIGTEKTPACPMADCINS